jgi:transposase-like protein
MPNEYPVEVRRSARRLWLTGRYSDEQIATQLGIPRADTIRDWRHQEGWQGLARDIAGVIDDEVKAGIRAQRGAFDSKYDQLGKALESRAIRGLNNPALSPRDLKAIAGTLAVAQKIREKAIGPAQEEDNVVRTIADIIERDRRRKNRLSPDPTLGRCLPSAGTNGNQAAVEPQPPPPGTTDDPAVSTSP